LKEAMEELNSTLDRHSWVEGMGELSCSLELGKVLGSRLNSL